jgi:asparagine synthase (glutamine-hydrolysing)
VTLTRHFFVLYRPGHPWPEQAVLDAMNVLPSNAGGIWQTLRAGPFLLGWASFSSNAVELITGGGGEKPFLHWAGDLDRPDGATSPEFAIELAEGRPETSARLDGAFAALAFNTAGPRAAIITDRFGLFPVYCHEKDGTFAYATSLRALTALIRPACQLDPRGVYEMLGLGMVLGNRTFLREVSLLPPATTVVLHNDSPTSTRYWHWHGLAQPTQQAEADLVHDTYDRIERAVLRSVADRKKIGVPLSGGLDSRMLCAVLAKNGVPFTAYNINFGRETAVARRVARALGVPLTVLPMLPYPEHDIPAAHDAVDCSYHVNQTWGFDMARTAGQDGCDVLLDGLAFDTILGSVHEVPAGDPAAMAHALQDNYHEVDRATLEKVAGPAAAADFMDTLLASLEELARECLEQAGPNASDYFVMTNRIRKYTFGYCLANLYHLPGAFPYVTRDLFEHCMQLPRAERHEHNLYRRIYREKFPELARIPWAKTGLPLDRYGPSPDQAAWRRWAEAVLRRLSGGRINFTYSWSFDAALRTRQDVRTTFARRLQTPRATVGGCLPPQTVPNTWEREFAGRNLGAFFQGLYTVENFLARLADEGQISLPEAGMKGQQE